MAVIAASTTPKTLLIAARKSCAHELQCKELYEHAQDRAGLLLLHAFVSLLAWVPKELVDTFVTRHKK